MSPLFALGPARSKPHDHWGVLCSCGRPAGAVLGCDASRHIPPTGHQLAAGAVPYPLPRALRPRYEADFAKRLGRFRLQRISSAVERFLDCGDYTKGIARIQRLLLMLPHRQIVFTHRSGHCTDFPKVLRVFFRYDRRLYGEISKRIYRIIQSFCNAAAGRRIQRAQP